MAKYQVAPHERTVSQSVALAFHMHAEEAGRKSGGVEVGEVDGSRQCGCGHALECWVEYVNVACPPCPSLPEDC